ncbi:hypothetical protein [Desulfovibrio sp. Huiquan2017]|uniref:hypothetical protein n=1 Tax=Desulfovibrio sp. Huiquan2017 TaxID=2816861 RepID=UPI001A92EA6C|nr:hypothetical protein [Desulfovibrio sp. Huiquan2017]
MNVNKIILSLGIIAFIAAFLPMATNDVVYIGVEHMGNLTKLLYLLPLGIIGLSCATTKVPFKCLGIGLVRGEFSPCSRSGPACGRPN